MVGAKNGLVGILPGVQLTACGNCSLSLCRQPLTPYQTFSTWLFSTDLLLDLQQFATLADPHTESEPEPELGLQGFVFVGGFRLLSP